MPRDYKSLSGNYPKGFREMSKTRTIAKWTDGACVQRIDYGMQVEYTVYDSLGRPLYHEKTAAEARRRAGRISLGTEIKK